MTRKELLIQEAARYIAGVQQQDLSEALTGGAKKAYEMGHKHGIEGSAKIDPVKSFGSYAQRYHEGYDDGNAAGEAKEGRQDRAAAAKQRVIDRRRSQ